MSCGLMKLMEHVLWIPVGDVDGRWKWWTKDLEKRKDVDEWYRQFAYMMNTQRSREKNDGNDDGGDDNIDYLLVKTVRYYLR